MCHTTINLYSLYKLPFKIIKINIIKKIENSILDGDWSLQWLRVYNRHSQFSSWKIFHEIVSISAKADSNI